MKIVAIIPCRYGSERFQGKPLVPILGRPMIWWVYHRAKDATILNDTVVATDDERILHCVKDFGGKVLMTSSDHRSGTDRVAEAARLLKLNDDDIVINIQGDQPAFDSRCIDQVVGPLLGDRSLEMSTLVYRITNPNEISNPNNVKAIFDLMGYALYFSRSSIPYARDHSLQFDYYKHIGIYAYRKSFLERFISFPQGRLEKIEKLEQLRALEHGHRIKVVETTYDSVEIDVAEDVEKAENALRKQGVA
nr:3-deoxy-manno-octulosonate cytidylyltransferase [Desulfobacterales bacterium]